MRKLTVCAEGDEWLVLSKEEHEGIEELRRTPYGAVLFMSRRLTDADIEGPCEDWAGVAEAIEKRSGASYRRCGVERVAGGFEIESPRNSTYAEFITDEEADYLAARIREALSKPAA